MVTFGTKVPGETVCSGGSDQRTLRPQPTGVEGAALSATVWKELLQSLQSMETATGLQESKAGTWELAETNTWKVLESAKCW